MDEKDCILAVDVGTQSLRACVIDPQLETVAWQKVPYTPDVKSGQRVEIDAEVLWDALVRACDVLESRERVRALTFSTLCPSLVPLDGEGRPLYPIILHLDRRSQEQARWALEKVGEDCFLNIAGNLPIPGGISVTSLLWIRDHLPEIYHRPDVCFGHAITFFMKRLTNRFIIDPSNASFSGLYDTVGYTDWDEALLAPLEIHREKLPKVIHSPTVAGHLIGPAAALLGLPAGLPVVIGANDTTCASVGAGVVTNGDLMNTSGTVEILVVCLDKPIVSKDHLLRTHAYPGKWLAMRTVGAGGASLEWFRNQFCRDMDKTTFYDAYLGKVLSTRCAPEAVFDPFLAGDRHRIREKTGAFRQLTLNSTRDDLLLALTHGIVSFQTQALDQWETQTRIKRQIYHVGGGASAAYTGYKQNLLKQYQFIPLGETTLSGAARLAIEALS